MWDLIKLPTQTESESKIAVFTNIKDEQLDEIAKRLALPIVSNFESSTQFYLLKLENQLCLRAQIGENYSHLCVDFSSGEAEYRRLYGGGKNQPLAKAVGMKKSGSLNIVDATAGFGGDAFVLACLGNKVTMLEKSSIIAELLRDGLARGLQDEQIEDTIKRMELVVGPAEQYLAELVEKPDVIYLDPMFPERKKTAKVKKEMQALQAMLVYDDTENLMSIALQSAQNRVVVKRPKGSEYLNGFTPSHRIESKKTRYDVYMCLS